MREGITRVWSRLIDKLTGRDRLRESVRQIHAARAEANEEKLERTKILENSTNMTAEGLKQAGLEKNASEAYQSAALLANRRKALEVKVSKEKSLMDGMFGGVKSGG